MDNFIPSEKQLAVDAAHFYELRKRIAKDLDEHSASFRLI
jgi:hypothetical protein